MYRSINVPLSVRILNLLAEDLFRDSGLATRFASTTLAWAVVRNVGFMLPAGLLTLLQFTGSLNVGGCQYAR